MHKWSSTIVLMPWHHGNGYVRTHSDGYVDGWLPMSEANRFLVVCNKIRTCRDKRFSSVVQVCLVENMQITSGYARHNLSIVHDPGWM